MTISVDLETIVHEPGGPATRPPLLIAHGLFGSARNFNTLGRKLASDRRVILADMRNHGGSPWADEMSYEAMAADLAAVIDRHAGGRAVVLGHSMGGKAAMALALTAPDSVAGLIVADIAPVAYGHSHSGYLAAMQTVDLSAVTRRSDADPMLAGAIPDPGLRAFILQNLAIEGGAGAWRLNLAALAANMEALIGWPASLAGRVHDGAALFLHGGASDYVAPEHHAAVRAQFPQARIEALPGAGHWLHAEQPGPFLAAVEGWLARLG